MAAAPHWPPDTTPPSEEHNVVDKTLVLQQRSAWSSPSTFVYAYKNPDFHRTASQLP
jgi:hypothetical protein